MPVFTADDGVQIHYDVRGDNGPGIILSHGWCGTRNHWAPQMAHFSKNYRVLSIDRRGYGASTPPADYKYSLEREAKDAAQIAESLGFQDVLVVGHAGGFPGALGLAAMYPKLVRGLVLEEGVPLGHTPAMDELVNNLIANISGPGFSDAMRGIYPNFFHPTADVSCVAMCADDAARTPQNVAVGYLEALHHMDAFSLAQSLKMPVLFVWGEIPLRPITVEELRTAVPQANLVAVPGTGHFVHLDNPAGFNAELDKFLATLPAHAG
jgi:pimeloyl-ACP methyl ester carboxylesterase